MKKLFVVFFVFTAAGLLAQSKAVPHSAAERPLVLLDGYIRLSEAEITTLKQARDGLMLQLIAERNAMRAESARHTSNEKSKLRATRRDVQAQTLRDMAEIEEQIRTGIRAERKP